MSSAAHDNSDSLLQSETVRLAQAGQWGQIGQKGASATKKGMLVVSTEARNRHSVLQVAVPLELDDTDEAHLRDEQACQIFWNCVVTEMLVQFLWSGTSATTASVASLAKRSAPVAPIDSPSRHTRWHARTGGMRGCNPMR